MFEGSLQQCELYSGTNAWAVLVTLTPPLLLTTPTHLIDATLDKQHWDFGDSVWKMCSSWKTCCPQSTRCFCLL